MVGLNAAVTAFRSSDSEGRGMNYIIIAICIAAIIAVGVVMLALMASAEQQLNREQRRLSQEGTDHV